MKEGIFWIILTVFLEARDQSIYGQINVAKVIMNRANKNNWNVRDVVLARKQFSCYNDGLDKALAKVAKEPYLISLITLNVMTAIDEWEAGNKLIGATHYYSPKAMNPPDRVPSWVPSMTFVGRIGDHVFYREG